MTSFRTLRNSFIISAAMLGMAATTLPAQADPGRHATAAEHGQMKAKWAERHAARQAALHDKLALTPAQEAAWASYQAAIKPLPRAERGARGEWKTMSAPARLAKRIAMTKERTAMMESRLAALNSLYGALTPAQQKLFDENSMQRGRRGHGHGHGHGHGKHRMG